MNLYEWRYFIMVVVLIKYLLYNMYVRYGFSFWIGIWVFFIMVLIEKYKEINLKNGNEIEYFFNYFGNLNKVNWFYDNGWKWFCL